MALAERVSGMHIMLQARITKQIIILGKQAA